MPRRGAVSKWPGNGCEVCELRWVTVAAVGENTDWGIASMAECGIEIVPSRYAFASVIGTTTISRKWSRAKGLRRIVSFAHAASGIGEQFTLGVCGAGSSSPDDQKFARGALVASQVRCASRFLSSLAYQQLAQSATMSTPNMICRARTRSCAHDLRGACCQLRGGLGFICLSFFLPPAAPAHSVRRALRELCGGSVRV
jgi:hypothetical protein